MEHEILRCLSHYVYVMGKYKGRVNKIKVRECVCGLEVVWLTWFGLALMAFR
jgi:hypothetical protein